MTTQLFIPYLNRYDLLEKAIASVSVKGVDITVINNSGALSGYSELIPPVPLTFAQSHNWMLDLAADDPFYLWMHNDAEAEGDTVLRLIAQANAYTIQKRKWGAIFTNYDALAAFNTEAFHAVGGWDQNLVWYASECDIYRRLKLAGYDLIESNLPVKHTPSQTLNADPEVKRSVDWMIPFRLAYYKAKWGGGVGHEKFLTPFNE